VGETTICAVLIAMEYAAQINRCVVRSVSLAMETNAKEIWRSMNICQSENA